MECEISKYAHTASMNNLQIQQAPFFSWSMPCNTLSHLLRYFLEDLLKHEVISLPIALFVTGSLKMTASTQINQAIL